MAHLYESRLQNREALIITQIDVCRVHFGLVVADNSPAARNDVSVTESVVAHRAANSFAVAVCAVNQFGHRVAGTPVAGTAIAIGI